jgi:hypothetical protein
MCTTLKELQETGSAGGNADVWLQSKPEIIFEARIEAVRRHFLFAFSICTTLKEMQETASAGGTADVWLQSKPEIIFEA